MLSLTHLSTQPVFLAKRSLWSECIKSYHNHWSICWSDWSKMLIYHDAFPLRKHKSKVTISVISHVLKRAHLGYLSGSSKKCSNNSDWLGRTRENLIVLIRYVQKIGQTKTRHYESMVRQWLDSSRQAGIDKLPDNCQVLAKAKKPPALSQASQQGGDLPPLRALVLNKYSHHLLQITHVD